MGSQSTPELLRLKEDAEKIIEQFFKGVPHALKKHREFSISPQMATLGDDLIYREESILCINRIRAYIEKDREELMEQATSDIFSYLTRYKVRSRSCDPLKLAYWFGQALATKVGEQHDLDRKVVLTLTVMLLDMFCEWNCSRNLPPQMLAKLFMSISQGKHEDDFGTFGIYFSFKSISKFIPS